MPMHKPLNQARAVTEESFSRANARARIVALSAHSLPWGTMRTIFTIANVSTIVLLASQIGTDPGWWMALFAIVMSVLAYVSDKKQRRVEYQQVKNATFDAIESLYASEQSNQERDGAAQD
jgi:hypothetical protein